MSQKKTKKNHGQPAAPEGEAPATPEQLNAALIGTAWRVALPFLFFAFGGIALDRALDTEPLFSVVGLILAFVGTGVVVAKYVNRLFPGTIGRKK